MRKEQIKNYIKKAGKEAARMGISLCVAAFFISIHVQASNGNIITTAFNSLYDVVASIVSNIGQLFLLWGVFEMAASMNTQDGMAQSSAFKRVGGGLIACIAPQIIPLINTGAN